MSDVKVLDSNIFLTLAHGLKGLGQDAQTGSEASLRHNHQVSLALDQFHQAWGRAANSAREACEACERRYQAAEAERARLNAAFLHELTLYEQRKPNSHYPAGEASLLQAAEARKARAFEELARARERARQVEAGYANFKSVKAMAEERLARHLQAVRQLRQSVDQEVVASLQRLIAMDERVQAYLQS